MQLSRPPSSDPPSSPSAHRPVTRALSASPSKPPPGQSQSGPPSSIPVIDQKKGKDKEEAEKDRDTSARPKRITKAPQRLAKAPAAPPSSSVAGMSEKELKAATQRNTSKNEVYHCAIDRQIVRINAPRPPSPTSKIRTTADREESERKASRGERAQRRSKGSGGDESEDDLPPLVERIERTRGPGDEEDYSTPARPAKKTKVRHGEKNVKWDRALVVIRDDGRPYSPPAGQEREKPRSQAQERELKSALKDDGVRLDRYGNIIEGSRPKEALKRQRIVVTAVFYEGEEPVPVPTAPTSAKGKKK